MEEFTKAVGIPTPVGLMRHLGLLEREWAALQSNPTIQRICEMALMRIDEVVTEMSLHGAINATFSEKVLKKDVASWKKYAASTDNRNPNQIAGATFNGPTKIEICIARSPRNERDINVLEDAERQQLEELGLPVEPLRLGLHKDETMKDDVTHP